LNSILPITSGLARAPPNGVSDPRCGAKTLTLLGFQKLPALAHTSSRSQWFVVVFGGSDRGSTFCRHIDDAALAPCRRSRNSVISGDPVTTEEKGLSGKEEANFTVRKGCQDKVAAMGVDDL
jgi:hypothetical protein